MAGIFSVIREKGTRFQDIPKLLPPPSPKNEDTLHQCKSEIIRKLASTDWETKRAENIGAEVVAILEMAQIYGEILIDDAVVTALFQTNNFILPVGDLTLGLLHYLITLPPEVIERPGMARGGRGGMDIDMEMLMAMEGFEPKPRSFSSALQRAVSVWINRLFNFSRDPQNAGAEGGRKRKKGILSGLARGIFSGGTAGPGGEAGDLLPEIALTQLLENLLRWWTETCTRLQGEKSTLVMETEWVIGCHFASIFLTGPALCREFLKEISLVAKHTKLPPMVQRAYVSALRDATRQVPGDESMRLLYPDTKTMLHKQQKNFSTWQRSVHREVVEQLLLNSDIARESKKKKTLLGLLQKDKALWPLFAFWFIEQQKTVEGFEKLTEGQTATWQTIEKVFIAAKAIFEEAYTSMLEYSASIALIKICVGVASPEVMKNCWDSVGIPPAVATCDELSKEIDQQWEVIQKIKIVVDTFFVGSETQKTVHEIITQWDSLQIKELRCFFRTHNVVDADLSNIRFPTLTVDFLNAWKWLSSLVPSDLFKLVWSEQKGSDDLPKLIPASAAFKKEYDDLKAETTTFARMKKIAPILNSRDERKYFCNAAPGYTSKDGASSWVIIGSKKKVKSDIRTLMADWLHLFAVHQTIRNIIRVLDCLHLFIKASGIPSLDLVKNAAASLCSVFQKEVFDEKTIAEQPRFIPDSSKIHECFVILSPDLFESIVKCMAVLDWLRELPDDSDFTNGIEEAMGKSEMECPVELWQEEEGKPGRVDEQKLSMLSTVRGYLHDLIYRPSDRLDNLDALINILKELRATDDNIINSLITANQYRIPLRELLDDKSENGAPDRLIQLLLPIRKAKWLCTSESDDKESTTGQIWLRWEVPRGGIISEKKQNLNELMDFQSSIVLAKTDQQGPDVMEAIDNFIQGFGWIRQLNENLSSLWQSGHFDFQNFDVTFPLSEDPEVIRAEAVRCSEILSNWTTQVETQRNSSYFLNFYSMRHVWKLVSTIRAIKADEIDDLDQDNSNYVTMKDILCLLNPDNASADSVTVNEFIRNFHTLWTSTESDPSKPLVAIDALALCGKCLEETLKDLESRHRPVDIEEISMYPAGADIEKGVNILCADNSEHVFDHILSAFARVGYLPERELVYVCRESSTWDDVYTLLLRWARSHLHERKGKFYCLAGIENISFELQRKAATIIRENMVNAENPLLVISGNDDKQHLVAQFAHLRTSVISLPVEVIQKYSNEISVKYSQGIAAHTSQYAGAGKTFNIKRKAAGALSSYVPVAVMRADNVLSHINKNIRSRNLNCEMDYITLHLDIYDTAADSLSPLLFDLVYLGGIEDNIAGIQFFWNPELASIAIEVPTGNLIEKVRVCALVPQCEAVVTGATFCNTMKGLKEGMGDEDFITARNDGTSIAVNSSSPDELNAYTRLQYVCTGLDIMDNNQGRFPFVFEKPNVSLLESLKESQNQTFITKSSLSVLSPERCFELLMNALDLEKPSLWCIWNFINVFYWQLRDMHAPDSPINCACMPDPNAERKGDTETKAKYKGEVVQFLIRTAREFATRQVKEVETNAIQGVFVSGMSRQEFNGYWERMECENDGKPTFQKRSAFGSKNFIYYRKEEGAWVIDDCIDPTGPVYSRCEPGLDMDALWSTTPEWCENTKIKVEKIKDKRGYQGEAVRVSGCCDDGGSVSEKENGIYLRQPEYDDINGNPHYIHTINENLRRHIFIGNDHGWQICPICTDEEGTFCMSSSKNVTGRWRAMPPDKKEERAKFITLTEDQIDEYKKKPAASFARSEVRDRVAERNEKLALRDSLRVSTTGVEEEEDDGEETMEQLWDNTLKWNDSNHECVLFSNQTHVVSFLSLDPERLRNRMHPGLLTHLKRNQINVGEDLNILSSRFHEILSALTEVNKTPEEAKKILDGKYCLTGDSLLKMLAIFARLRCGVPVVLMGECGCGKTMLINYICAWMGVKLLILDVHGGTSEEDILGVFDRAERALKNGDEKVFVLLDEINTCSHMGLMCEVICHRSLYSKRLDDRIHVLAALNPYRRRPDSGRVPGLVFQLQNGGNAPPDPMAQLVYRVHPIPKTLRDFIFDFGALTPANEKTYILSMVKDKLPNESQFVVDHIGNLIHYSQQFIRKTEKDDSSASLRDVRRCLRLVGWFQDIVVYRGGKDKMISSLACSTTLALAFVYYFRLGSANDRAAYWERLGVNNKDISWRAKEMDNSGFLMLREEGAFLRVIKTFQNFIGSQMIVEDGIAMNDALMENLFVVIICILTRIPIFVVGKPGSSKTLTMQVIASNLQGKQSPVAFWRKYPAVYIFPYQCSPMSDSHSIQHQFDMAVRYQQHAENTITVLLLDEVGLAEHSPEMPLKVLHGMLVDPPISVVGLSNWVLDPAKMNRAILLQRTEPSQDDIQLTGKSIVSAGRKQSLLDKYLSPLAKAYHKIYTNQKGRDFVGMRDYYNLVKLLRLELSRQRGNTFSADLLTVSLCRNFGGKRDLLRDVLTTFHINCFGNTDKLVNPPVTNLISANLEDQTARHLMLLTRNSAALPLMFGCNLLNERTTKVLVGSEFKDDRTELHLITQINEVKLAMAEGSRLVLLNHDNIYEALYDVLNQRYLFKKDQNGNVKKMLRLAIGSRSQLCNVADGFKIVVIVEQDHAYRNLDLPLLNRFEKQVLCGEDVLGPRQRKVVDQMTQWVEQILENTGLSSMQEVFCGYHDGTIPSAVLNICKFNEENIDETTVEILKTWLLQVARPIAVMNSKELKSLSKVDYFEQHSCLGSILEKFVFSVGGFGATTVTLTHSPISHLDDAVAASALPCGYVTLQLGELTSERQLFSHLRKFFTTEKESDQLIIIQCDPISCRQSLINHARYVCIKERSQYEYEHRNDTALYKRHVLFLVHLPPGTKQRNRHFALDFIHPWDYVFVDDLRTEETGSKAANTVTLLTTSVFDLVNAGSVSLRDIYMSKFQHALSSCSIPDVTDPAAYFGARVEVLQRLLQEVPEFSEFVERAIMEILETYSTMVSISNKEDAIKVPIHVRMVCNDLVGGSLRQSLDIAIETLIVQAFAHVLCELDCNFNLSTVWSKGKEKESFALWLSLLQNTAIADSSVIARKSKVGQEAFVRSKPVRNTGIFEALVTKFPYSYRLIPILNDRSTREQVEGIGGDAQEKLIALCPSLFGEDIVKNWIEFGKNEHIEYLHDFVATAMIPVPGAEFSVTYELCEKLFRITRPDSIQSPAGIHVAAWENENRLFRCSSLLANNRVHASARDGIIASINSIETPSMGASVAPEAIKDRLAAVDFCMLANLLANNWDRIRDATLYSSDKLVSDWINEFSSIRSDLELYLLDLTPFEGRAMYKDVTLPQLRASFLGLRVIHIYFQETMSELMFQQQNIRQPTKIIELAQNLQLTEMEFLQKLIPAYYDNLEQDYRYLGISFIRRYLQEVVFGEQEGFYNIGSNHTFPSQFLEALESIFANDVRKKEFIVLTKDLALRRALLHCLLKANYKLKLAGTEALQLYLQYEFDKLSELKGWKSLGLLTSEDTKLCIQNAAKTKNKKDLLEAMARAQCCIHEYGELLVHNEGELFSSYLFPELDNLLTIDDGHLARVLVMKVIKGLGGIDGLGQIVHAKEEIKWMRINRGMSANTVISLPDPFVWIKTKEAYEQLCGAVRSCATQSTNQTVQLEKIKPADLRNDLLIATLFSQVALESDSLFDKGVEALRKWISGKIIDKTELKLTNWVCNRCPEISKVMDTQSLSGMCQLQVGMNLAIWAVSKPGTWLHSLFFDVSAHKDSFLISVPNDEFAEVVKASGRVGWYLCPNGHKYSVGQCTMPMQKARCPTCGATIGGSNHVNVQGVRRLGDDEIKGDPDRGYSIENNESECVRLPTLSGRFLRYVLHNGLLFSCCIDKSFCSAMAKLLSSDKQVNPIEYLNTRLQYDWKRMKHLSGLGDGDLALVLHMAIKEFRDGTTLAKGSTIKDTNTRDREEAKLSAIINRYFSDSSLKAKIQNAREQLEDANSTSTIRLTTGEKLWYEIHEEQFAGNASPDLQSLLWRYREPVSFEGFTQYWNRQLDGVKQRYSLLRTLLKEEEKLPSIRGVCDILAWHSILFEVIPHMSLTRTDGIDMTNKDVIEKLPAERQAGAREVLARFCEIFNLILPTIDPLFECTENPFITNGKIDLGDGAVMDENTPVGFSLPSTITGEDKGNYIHGMCTIRILQILVDSQNEILVAIEESGKKKKGGFKRMPGGGPVAAAQPEPAVAEQPREIPNVPAVSYKTPTSVLENQLVIYNRDRDFLPLLRMFADQSLSYKCGGDLSYKVDMIEAALANGLLAGKRQINLCISHYQYRGDVKVMGQLSLLESKLPQERVLPSNIKESIMSEIDTQNKTVRLRQILEVCIQFIVSIGSSNTRAFDGRTTLSSCIKNLQITQEEWDQVSTPTVRQQICLRHIQPLYLLLESMLNGNPLDNLPSQYCENITAEQEDTLRFAVSKLDLSVLIPELHDFMIRQLATSDYGPDLDMKEYLGYGNLGEEDWWDEFPDCGFTFANAKAVYDVLEQCT